MKVSYRTFKISWNTYFLNYLCQTWFHGQHLVDSNIALVSKSLTLPNVYAFTLSILLIALMVFTRLAAAFYTETAHECTWSQLYDVHHAWYVVPQCRPLESRGLKCWLQLACHRVHQQNVNRSGSHTQSSKTLRATSPVLLTTSRCSQTLLELSKVLSDFARVFTGAPDSTCSYGGAFRMLRDLTYRIVKFWSFWDLCADLPETLRAVETAA